MKLSVGPATIIGGGDSEREFYPPPEVPVVEMGRAPE